MHPKIIRSLLCISLVLVLVFTLLLSEGLVHTDKWMAPLDIAQQYDDRRIDNFPETVVLTNVNPAPQKGVYIFNNGHGAENHYIVLDSLSEGSVAVYYGTHLHYDHSVLYYASEMENFKVDKNSISFELPEREYYTKSRFRIQKSIGKQREDIPVGSSKGKLQFSGTWTNDQIELICTSSFNECLTTRLTFQKVVD
jgi:hypothetical protein